MQKVSVALYCTADKENNANFLENGARGIIKTTKVKVEYLLPVNEFYIAQRTKKTHMTIRY